MTVGEKLIWIGDNLKNVYGKGFVVGHGEGYRLGYDEGAYQGGIAAREVCLLSHFVTTVNGNGTGEMEFAVPFRPDIVMVYTTHPFSSEVANTYRGIVIDFRSAGRHMANVFYCDSNAAIRSGWIRTSSSSDNFKYSDGYVRVHLTPDSLKTLIWPACVRYDLVAVKMQEDAKEVICNQITALPDTPVEGSSGQLSYDAEVIAQYFTDEQWTKLTATKPNWEFVLT